MQRIQSPLANRGHQPRVVWRVGREGGWRGWAHSKVTRLGLSPPLVDVFVRQGFPVLTLPLPSRNERCEFTLRPYLQTVSTLLDSIKVGVCVCVGVWALANALVMYCQSLLYGVDKVICIVILFSLVFDFCWGCFNLYYVRIYTRMF